MAEEEVIILEEDEKQEEATLSKTEKESPKGATGTKGRKRLILLLSGTGVLLFVLLVIFVVLLMQKETKQERHTATIDIAKKIKSAKPPKPVATPSQIERMIRKANILYERGEKREALNLFEQIATYSASVSYYNLGVAQMHQELYKEAIESFKKAIQNGENLCISAINAAVCALHLKEKKLFDYYLEMTEANLPECYNSSLYGYLYALVNYYRGNYFELLSAVEHPTAQSYVKELDHIGAIGYRVFDRPLKAIALLERDTTPYDFLLLGQLYANIGEYPIAAQYLQRAVEESTAPVESRKALALVQLKNLMPAQAARLLRTLQSDFKGKSEKLYPIQTKLAPAVYDIHAAQKRYGADTLTTPPDAYKLLFEFAPFKVFNAMQTLSFIKKGNASIYVDEAPEAARYLSKSSSISRANLLISKAIKAAIDHRLRKANRLLEKALRQYPNHSILHYNLALTYAQLGNYSEAHRHFLRSYHLDSTNFLSAIFALMCETIIQKPIPQIEQFLNDDLSQILEPTESDRFHQALFQFYKGNIAAAGRWLKQGHDHRPLYLLLDILVAAGQGDWKNAERRALTLRDRMPRDLLANLLYLKIRYREEPVKQFSMKVQKYLRGHPLDLDAVYYGSVFTRENYIALRFVTGTLYRFNRKLEEKLLEEKEDPVGIMEALALSDIFLKKYENAYTLFNQLLDTYDIQDSHTLFLAAVAAVGAGHGANAAALLELAKLTDPNNLESRYALGLLYLEQENVDAAIIQFSKIPDGTFHSEFFDFDIVGYMKKRKSDEKR
ncbi:tetratricopeptide repeat protein [Hydrogenimonas sp.]